MRIIQDSEDEDDFEIDGSEVARPQRDAPLDHNSSNDSPKPGEKGTGSTESLKRAIVAAHCAQFRDGASSSERQDQSDPSRVPSAAKPYARSISQDAPESSISLPGHAKKRRRTSLDGAVALSSTRDIFPITYGERHAAQADGNTNAPLGPTSDKPWSLQGTMQEDWEHHEPMGLFPHSASSTIPNATATQQQLLAEVLAPAFLGIEPEPEPYDAPKYEPAKSSVPWSEYLKSSSRGSQVPPPSAEQPSLSPCNACDLTEHLGESRTLNGVTAEPIAPTAVSPPCPVVKPVLDDETTANQFQLQSGLDAPIVSPPDNNKQKLSSVPNSEVDSSAIGLPKEQYKPRPSRSRSLKLSGEEPIDYSIRPEAAAKKTRRTRTSGGVITVPIATTPEKVRQICDMGFTPITIKKALRQHNAEDELAPPKCPKGKTRRKSRRDANTQDHPTEAGQSKPREAVVEDLSISVDMSRSMIPDNEVPECAPAPMVTKSPTVVKVVIPKTKKPTTPSKHEDPQATAPGALQHVAEDASEKGIDRLHAQPEEQPIATIEAPKEKKRGRGRPKKETKTIEPIEEEPPEEDAHRANMSVKETSPDEMNKPEERAPTTGDSDGDQASKAADAELRPNATHTTSEPQPPPEKKMKQTNDVPTSISKGKTPYRVGLSKRARIAPLLRIVKK